MAQRAPASKQGTRLMDSDKQLHGVHRVTRSQPQAPDGADAGGMTGKRRRFSLPA